MTAETALEKGRRLQREARERGERIERLTPMEKAQRQPGSLRFAINAKCYSCVYDPLAGGTWLQQVEECRIEDCPLWSVRPQRTVA